MINRSHSNSRTVTIISDVADDGTIIEMVYRPASNETALVVAQGDNVRTAREWPAGQETLTPVSARNNLIAHNVLLLPSATEDFGTVERLVSEIEAYIRRYVALPEDAIAVSATYVLLTWVYDVFNEVPYLRFRGDYGTGKTRALTVIGSLCYKAFFASGASTISPIFHTLDTFRGTLIFDEADFRFSDEKAELVKILNNGNAKGFPVLRTRVTPKKEFDPQAFTIFGPKIVGMRRSYEDRALESRFLTFEMAPGRPKGIPLNLSDRQKDEALKLRNKLLMYRLHNRLKAALDPSLADPALEPRMNQMLLPLLSISPNEDIRTIIRYTARHIQVGNLMEREGSPEGQVLAVLTKTLASDSTAGPSLADISATFIEDFGDDYARPITNRWIGSILRRLGLVLYKSNGVMVIAPGQRDRIDALCDRYGVAKPDANPETAEAA